MSKEEPQRDNDILLEGWDVYPPIPKSIPACIPVPFLELPRVLSTVSMVEYVDSAISYYRSFCNKRFLFRGHSDSSYKLVSTLGRMGEKGTDSDRLKYKQLKQICLKYKCDLFRLSSFNEELFYLSIGRHLTFTCRLLDWTVGFWAAISFLLYDNPDKDGSLWVMSIPQDFAWENRNPFEIKDNKIHILKEDYYIPDDDLSVPLGIMRRSHQNGVFTVVGEKSIREPLNSLPDNGDGLAFREFIIPKSVKDALRNSTKLISVDEWFYINKSSPIIEEISDLNSL